MDTQNARFKTLGFGCKIFDNHYVCLPYADVTLMLAICEQFVSEFNLKFTCSESVL